MSSARTPTDPSAARPRARLVMVTIVVVIGVTLSVLAGLWVVGTAGYWPGSGELRAAAEQLEERGSDGCSSVEAEADWLRGRVVVTRGNADYLVDPGGGRA